MRKTFASKGLRCVADFRDSLQSEKSRKKIVCIKKMYKINHAGTSLLTSISFIVSFNKAGAFWFVLEEA